MSIETLNSFDAFVEKDAAHVMHTYGRYPVALVKGKGTRVWDVDGKEYIDLLAGIAVASLGHCNDELIAVVEEQSRTLWHVSNLFYQKPQLELAENLLATAGHLGKVFFCNSGAEANEALIKLARRYTSKVLNRPEAVDIITLSGCFHGRTYGSLAATGRDVLCDGFQPMPQGFKQVPAGDLAAMEKAIDEKTCAVLIEVVQGEGGVIVLDDNYVRGVEELCRKKGVLFCCDEVQSGMCRSGAFWAFQTCGVKPDIISMAKALANGLPMGGIMATDEAAKGFQPGSHATTFGGTPFVAAVAAKTVAIMTRDKMFERARRLGERVMGRAREYMLAHPDSIREVRGKGLFIGIELPVPGRDVWKGLLDRGFICNLCHETTLRLLPPLTISEEELDAFMDALESLLPK